MKNKKFAILSALMVTACIGLARAATIKGKVSFSGVAPKSGQIKMNADPKCLALNPGGKLAEEVVVDKDGSVANVFVYIKQGLEGKKFPTPTESKVVFDQKGCWYYPHVFGIQVNQTLEIMNSDPTMHNVNAMAKKGPPFNASMPANIKPMSKKFTKPEVMVKIKCNVHPWMTAYAGVVDHPFYAVSANGGSFEIKDIPAGKYVVEAWHEKFGAATQEVTVAEGTATVSFTFESKKK